MVVAIFRYLFWGLVCGNVFAEANPTNLKKFQTLLEKNIQIFRSAKSPEEKGSSCIQVVKIQYYLYTKTQKENYKNNLLKTIPTCERLPLEEKQKLLLAKISNNLNSPSVSMNVEKNEPSLWNIALEFFTWDDQFTLNTPSGEKKILSSVTAYTLGLERKKIAKDSFGSLLTLGVLMGSANFGTLDGTTFQDNVSLYGFLSKLGFTYKKYDLTHFSLSLPLMYAKGNYSTPANSSYDDKGVKKNVGVLFESYFESDQWNFHLGLGHWFNEKNLLFNLGLSYNI
jgi:hypothetical protein